ncbi:UNVERIFIED_ORG: hypothetical protein HNP28_003928 [Comamonas terrigena]
MSNFYTILTNIGAALHANAQVQQTTVPWTHMALGDGNGNPVVPQQSQAGLVREVHRLPITSLEQHPDNPNWIVVEAVVPSDVGGWTVRETALYGGAGGSSCIAVGNYPATYKPVLAEGAAREMVMRMVIEVSSVATVKLVIDPAVAIASRKWVESLVATPAKAGLVKLATVDEAKAGQRDDVAVTPEGLDAALDGIGGLPRFTPYLWGGRGDATPAGDAQSSGQQLLELMFPTMRAEVTATQFICTEAEWQASPMKRLTHWSLGGPGWMRPPDKNCVQPGSLEGGFYGTGVGPASPLLGTAVLDTLQGHAHEVHASMSVVSNTSSGQMPMNNGAHVKTNMVAKTIISDGVNGDPRVAAITKPRTWYGIWMIRMYGRVTNAGDLNAPALNARMDMIDARVSALESGSSSITKNGFKIHPDGEIEQWGVLESVNLSSQIYNITYPIPFPNQVFNPSVTFGLNALHDGSTTPAVIRSTLELSGMQIGADGNALSSAVTGNIYWRVKGK